VAKPVYKSDRRRVCLSCGKLFPSLGPYNRRCEKCARSFDNSRLGRLAGSGSRTHTEIPLVDPDF